MHYSGTLYTIHYKSFTLYIYARRLQSIPASSEILQSCKCLQAPDWGEARQLPRGGGRLLQPKGDHDQDGAADPVGA